MNYKYDFELSSKRKIFLWLYQLLPDIDLIRYIYSIKEKSEYDEILNYYTLCPKNIKIAGVWIPENINDSWKIMNLKEIMKLNMIQIKLIVSEGLICSFKLPDDLTNEELELLNNGFWEFCATAVDYNTTLSDKIDCVNDITCRSLYPLPDIYRKFKRIGDMYDTKQILTEDA